MKLQFLTGILLAALCVPLSVSAETEQVVLTPPEQMPHAVGSVLLCMDSDMNGAYFEMHRMQDEGDFLYYTYAQMLGEDVTVECPLWEGNYVLYVTRPAADSEEIQEHRYEFTVDDPDNDPEQRFDSCRVELHFSTDEKAKSNSVKEAEPEIQNRVLLKSTDYVYAQRKFALGDLNVDGAANASDAAELLIAAAEVGAGNSSGLTALQAVEADLNGDGTFNSADAADLLGYAAASASGSFRGSLLAYMRGLKAEQTK